MTCTLLLGAEDYDDFDTSPYSSEAATYFTAYDTWEQEQAMLLHFHPLSPFCPLMSYFLCAYALIPQFTICQASKLKIEVST